MTQPCDERTPRFHSTKMLVTAAADEVGARIEGLRAWYTADGRPHLLRLPFELLMCGDRVFDELPAAVCPAAG